MTRCNLDLLCTLWLRGGFCQAGSAEGHGEKDENSRSVSLSSRSWVGLTLYTRHLGIRGLLELSVKYMNLSSVNVTGIETVWEPVFVLNRVSRLCLTQLKSTYWCTQELSFPPLSFPFLQIRAQHTLF